MTFPDSISLPPTDTRDAWLAQRSRGIGGSDVSAILGLNRWSSPLQVWLDKTGRGKPQRRTWAMVKGSALESSLLDWFEDHQGVTVHRAIPTQQSRDTPWMLGNLDGAGSDESVVETKTTSWWLREEWEGGQVADHAELQAQWYMGVTGYRHAWIVVAVSDDEPTWVPLARDDNLIGTMVDACGRFWRDYVLADKEPPAAAVDLPELRKRKPTEGVVYFGDDETGELIRSYQEAAEREKSARQWKSDMQAALLQEIGEASTLVIDGKVAATRKTVHKDSYTVEYAARDEVRLTVPRTRKEWKR